MEQIVVSEEVKALASAFGKTEKQLSGDNAQETKEIKSWIDYAQKELKPALTDDKLKLKVQGKLNSELGDKVFFVGNKVSYADLSVLSLISPLIKSFKPADQLKFSALVRWFDYLQHHPGVAAALNLDGPLSFSLNLGFNPPTTPAKPAQTQQQNQQQQQKNNTNAKQANNTKQQQQQKNNNADNKKGNANAGADKKQQRAQQNKKQTETPKKTTPAPKQESNAPQDISSYFSRLNIKVGKVIEVSKHPNAESLYVEKIDLGEEKPRQIISGLVKFIPQDQLLNAKVLVLANLKAAKLRGVLSEGMVLCASNKEHTAVELLVPPEAAQVGERVTVQGISGDPDTVLNPKHEVFENAKKLLTTDGNKIATYNGLPLTTSAGVISCASLTGANIS